jgi:hypothetical protein
MAEYSKGDFRTTVLRGVPSRTYVRLMRVHDNRHLRMTYYNGTLEIASVRLLLHERARIELDMVVRAVACELSVAYTGVGSTTFHRAGDGPFKGHGKEPDEGYYFANVGHVLGTRELSLDRGDLPPDLWIEVDGRPAQTGQLPLYAALGVPELWRYRARRGVLKFLQLTHGGKYVPMDRSLSLPMLTPSVVLEAVALNRGLSDSAWNRRLRGWVRETFRHLIEECP